jgi:inositol transport system substrate-binding protein
MKLRKSFALIPVLALLASHAGWSQAPSKLLIGCTLQNQSEEYMTMLKGAMELQLKKYPNVQLIINDGQGKAELQAAQLDSFIAQKAKAVIICPVDASALTPAVKAVVDAGIPCITLSADVAKNVGQLWIGSENQSGGETEAKFITEKLGGKGNIAILRGPLGAFAEQGRFEGYKRVFDKNPGIKVVFDQTGNWQRDQAMSLMENWLSTGTRIDAVLCQNDGMALGALEAIKAAGKLGKIKVAGIDAIQDALDSVNAGVLDATCFQDAIGQGKGALDLAVKAASGQHPKDKRVNIPFELVVKGNVAGYYSRIKLPKN